jgi:hypothetical protein
MYAVYYSVKKLEYLLSDIPFTWKTDHKNNTLNRSTGSDKVMRWDLYLQGFQMKKEYIKGEDNEISDTFSRLCTVSDINEYVHPLLEQQLEEELVHILSEMDIDNIANVVEVKPLTEETFKKISKTHNSTVGHHGVERTIKKLIKCNQTWPSMRADVIAFIKRCPCCQKLSQIKVPIHTSPYTTATYGLMIKLSMDNIGPLTQSDEGHTHILVIIDNFSRYVNCYALKGVTSKEVALAIIQHIGTFGCPSVIQMDNGPEFVNELVAEVMTLLGPHTGTILAYSKEENAIVERCNKEVMRHLRALVFEANKHTMWPQYLPLAKRIINSEVHSVTGVSPNDLVFGGKLELEGGILLDRPNSTVKPLSTWASEMLSMQDKLINLAIKRQQTADEKHLAQPSNTISQFSPNSFVLVSYPKGAMGSRPPTKLHTNLKGPMRVISNQGAEYTLHDLVRDKNINVHVSRLHRFEYDTARVDPLTIAAKDEQEDEVEKIISHTGDPKRKSTMDFLVRWTGYDHTEDLWLPWKGLRLNPALHTYLREHGMHHLIPK